MNNHNQNRKFQIIDDFLFSIYVFPNPVRPELNQERCCKGALPNDLIDFASNDYLGFLSPEIIFGTGKSI
jgi:8-amino-7-oxononanoate synthase